MAGIQRPDGIYSWVVAVACFWVTFVTQGLVRCGGVVYVYVIDLYQVGRGDASWPFILRLAVWNLSGPLAGALSYRWSIRTITFFGVLILALGNALCWFANDITAVTVFFGLLQGLGLGMVMTLVPVIINQYFVKYKSTGAGIACAGGTAGSFALPPVVELAVEEYGLHGAFLMMAGITLQGVLGAALMRPAPWLKKKLAPNKTEMSIVTVTSSNDVVKRDQDRKNHLNNSEYSILNNTNAHKRLSSNHLNGDSKHTRAIGFSNGKIDNTHVSEDAGECEGINETSNLLRMVHSVPQIVPTQKQTVEEKVYCESEDELAGTYTSTEIQDNGILRFVEDDEIDHKTRGNHENDKYTERKMGSSDYQPMHYNEVPQLRKETTYDPLPSKSNKGRASSLLTPLKNVWIIVRNAMFLVTAINYSIFFLSYMTYLIVIVDYAFDLGVDKTSSVFLVSAFSIADLCGRLGSGWITDSGLVKRRNLMVCNMMTLGILFVGTSFAKTYVAVISVSVAAGVVVGMNLIIFYALLEQYLGLQHMAMAVGLMNFMIGCISFVSPSLTGFFRDTMGSYDHLFQLIGALLFLCGTLWVVEPLLESRKKRAASKKTVLPNGR